MLLSFTASTQFPMPRATIVHVKPAPLSEQNNAGDSVSSPTVVTAIPVSPAPKALPARTVLARILPSERQDLETGDPTANFSPRESILFEGYKVSRILRYSNFIMLKSL